MRRLNPVSRARRAKTIQKLYDYWVDEDIPPNSNVSDSSRSTHKTSESSRPEDHGVQDWESLLIQRSKGTEQDTDSVWFSLPMRYVLQAAAVVSLLLITLSVVSTVLIAGSC